MLGNSPAAVCAVPNLAVAGWQLFTCRPALRASSSGNSPARTTDSNESHDSGQARARRGALLRHAPCRCLGTHVAHSYMYGVAQRRLGRGAKRHLTLRAHPRDCQACRPQKKSFARCDTQGRVGSLRAESHSGRLETGRCFARVGNEPTVCLLPHGLDHFTAVCDGERCVGGDCNRWQ